MAGRNKNVFRIDLFGVALNVGGGRSDRPASIFSRASCNYCIFQHLHFTASEFLRPDGIGRASTRHIRNNQLWRSQCIGYRFAALRQRHQESFRDQVSEPWSFGARLLIAFTLPSHVLAHEAHPTAQPATAAVLNEAPFLKENEATMIKMMNDMEIKPTGDINCDFVAMMSSHQQGAINGNQRTSLREERAAAAHRARDHRRPDAGDRRHEARDLRDGDEFVACPDATTTDDRNNRTPSHGHAVNMSTGMKK
jgi:hypothetical protein